MRKEDVMVWGMIGEIIRGRGFIKGRLEERRVLGRERVMEEGS